MAAEQREFTFEDRDFRFLAAAVTRKTGIVLGDQKRDLVYSRLARRLRTLQLRNFSDYCELLRSEHGEDEVGFLVNALTTNLTGFFREAHHFDHLEKTALPEIVSTRNAGAARRLRLWSAGCSSGEEPYSIAMTVKSAITDLARWDARILATDVDTDMVARGASGTYDIRRGETIPPAYRARFTEAQGSQIQMSSELCDLIAFKPLNLLEKWPMSGSFDVIFCRNVVIYFDKPTQQRLFDRYADILAENGWLYIGHSETLHRVSDRFEPVGRTIYRKIG